MRALLVLGIAAIGCGRLAFDETEVRVCDDCLSMTLELSSWEQAREACLARGSHLATISSVEENNAAAAFAATIPFAANETNTNQRQRMWIGGHNRGDSSEWAWDTGEPFDFMNWRVGEPDQLSERCMIMLGSENGLWDNRACTTAFEAFLCEKD